MSYPMRRSPGDDVLKRQVAVRIRHAREQSGLNMYEASAHLGIERRTLHRYESVRPPDRFHSSWPSVPLLMSMAVLYGVSIGELVPEPVLMPWQSDTPCHAP